MGRKKGRREKKIMEREDRQGRLKEGEKVRMSDVKGRKEEVEGLRVEGGKRGREAGRQRREIE